MSCRLNTGLPADLQRVPQLHDQQVQGGCEAEAHFQRVQKAACWYGLNASDRAPASCLTYCQSRAVLRRC